MTRLWQGIKTNKIPLLSFAAPLLLLLAAYAVFGIFPFGEHSVLVLDLAGQYVYFFEGLRDAILDGNGLLYSFSRSLGGEFLGIFAYYLASPFSLLVLLFPKSKITAAVLLILLLKTGAAGTTLSLYLKKRTPTLSAPLAIALSAAYALSGFAVAYQSNLMWMDALILLPLVILGLDRLIARRGFLLYVISLSLTFITNYYTGYMIAGFCLLYYLCSLFKSPRKSSRDIFINATYFVLFSVLAAIIAAFILFPAAYSLTLGKSDFVIPGTRELLLATPLELLAKLLPATYDSVMSDGTPFLFCGTFALLLLPLYFCSHAFSLREKLTDAALLFVLLLSMLIEPLDRIWHGFSAPNGLPCRYAFLFIFMLLVIAAQMLQAPREPSRKRLLFPLSVTCGALLTVIILLKATSLVPQSDAFLPIALIALLLTAVTLFFLLFRKEKTKLLQLLLAFVILGEIGANALYTLYALDNDVSFTDQASFVQSGMALKTAADRLYAEDSGFFRTETTEHLKSNDNMYAGLMGLSGSTSTLHADSISFLSQIGIPARWHRSLYLSANPLTDSLLGVKYLLSDAALPFYHPRFTEGSLTAYENPHALSLVYGIQADAFTPTVNAATNGNRLLSALTGTETAAFLPLQTGSTLFGGCNAYTSAENTLVYLPKSSDSVAFVTLITTASANGALFFTLPAPITAPVYLYINDVYAGVHFDTSCSYMLYLGHFRAGDTVRVRMVMADNDRPLQIYRGEDFFYFYDEAAANAALTSLAQTQLQIDAAPSHARLSGNLITTEPQQKMLFTVPFDPNWHIFVDGHRVETAKALGALVSFTVDTPGTHRIELKYRSPQLAWGTVISLLGIAALIGTCVIERKKRFFEKDFT